MKNITLLFLLVFFFPFVVFSQNINTEKSVINFTAGTMGIFKVKGSFTGFSGTVNFNPDNLSASKIDVCIDAKTVKSGNEKRDNHIKSEDFLSIEKYPNICFVSTEITEKADHYIAKGKLTIKETTHKVEIPLKYKNHQLTGNLDFQRLDYEVGENVGKFKAKDKISVFIQCELEE